MRKLTKQEYLGTNHNEEFAELHEMSEFKWGMIYGYDEFGDRNQAPKNGDEDYELYLRWHEIYSSPLAKALREE